MALKVLTVDDSKTIRMIVRKAFSPFDCTLLEAENGVEGLATAVKEIPDLIILDITMPVMNGIEMLAKVREHPGLRSTPVIMLTAESGKEKVMEILKLGIKNYMVKPFKGDQLIEKAQTVVQLKPKAEDDQQKSNGSAKYFSLDQDVQLMTIPEKVDKGVLVEIEGYFHRKLKEMATAGINKLIVDGSRLTEVNVAVIKLLLGTIGSCQNAGIAVQVAGSSSLSDELKGFKETSDIPIAGSLEEAKMSL